MTKGDKYEYNTLDRKQFILEVVSFDRDVVLFSACNKDDNSHAFDYEITVENLNTMISRNNIGLISKK